MRRVALSRGGPGAARFDRRELAAIFAGGATGGLLRVLLTVHSPAVGQGWPWTTFAINLSGAFALGYLATRLQERLPVSTYRRPFLGTGFCGALTTFSTVQIELLRMLDMHRYALAAGYAGASIVGGYVCVAAATAAVRRVRRLA